MAEIRKHRPGGSGSAITRALEQALGAAARPVTPGAPPQPEDPRQAPRTPTPRATSLMTTLPRWAGPTGADED